MNNDRLRSLLEQYFNDAINDADREELFSYLNNNPDDVSGVVDEEMLNLEGAPGFDNARAQKVLADIKADPRFKDDAIIPVPVIGKSNVVKLYAGWVKIAAAVLIFASVGFYFVRRQKMGAVKNEIAANNTAKIVPGSNKAILTLATGKSIVLDSAANGALASNGKCKVNKVGDGKLVYDVLPNATHAGVNAVLYNTLTIPPGGQYQVVLPDGTQVWLNSSSSLSYPTEFTGNSRTVKLTGEAYFEVAKNKDKPFYVEMNNVQVKVLGTHFNISAYADDNDLTTTLLEGSVQISKNGSLALLKPGQQAVIGGNANTIAVSKAHINEAMAWKNGYFMFNDDNIVDIMKKVSRWYDADIEYQGNFANQRFGGTFTRSKSITDLLKNLEQISNVHFKITGRRITVMQ
ncbi:FecR family protein [Mucilaginibacter kameinonensis]|uniref:FecR family protein n=1 Tax=Mucilaginibacter kameinonensis TaxID=452286 RepID=UPI000EF8087E|nr:FecR domain-containing protein [Mucilaginibacter kameinonensis]